MNLRILIGAFLVAAILAGAVLAGQRLAALEDNAVTIQVRCTGEDCREPLPRHGN